MECQWGPILYMVVLNIYHTGMIFELQNLFCAETWKLLRSCLIFFLFRLSGASLVVPFVHYWWPSLPANISKQGFQKLCIADQRTFQVAHHTPWLFYWWMTQKWFPSLSIMAGNMDLFSPPDMEIIKKLSETPIVGQVVVFVMQYVHCQTNY